MKVYLSGPMTGLPELNYPAFRAAAAQLRSAGDEVYNPADWETYGNPHDTFTGTPRKFVLHDAFADYCGTIIDWADAVVALPGWENSPGATAEVALARAIGKPVYAYAEGRYVLIPKAPACHKHEERQHRDRKRPWCNECGWRHGTPATLPERLGSSKAEREQRRLDAQAARLSDVP